METLEKGEQMRTCYLCSSPKQVRAKEWDEHVFYNHSEIFEDRYKGARNPVVAPKQNRGGREYDINDKLRGI